MAHAEYFNAQQKLQDIFANGQDWNGEQLRLALKDLIGSAVQMVRVKTQSVPRTTIPRTTIPRRRPLIINNDSSDSDSDSDSDTPQPAAARAAPLRPSAQLGPPPPAALVMPNQTGGLRPTNLTYGRITWHRYSTNFMKKRAIGAAKFNANCLKNCSICWETHTIGESVITDCSHCFGKQCWQTWMTHPNGNQKCPECRKHAPTTVFYSQRAERKSKQSKEDERLALINI
jgi:hypothetical protein